jgi:hypothetical protein
VKIIHTDTDDPSLYTDFEKEMIYNGLDCCVTRDVFDAIHPQLDEHTEATYAFSKALQGPTLEMRCRGVLVDQARKAEVIDEFFEKIDKLEGQLERIVLDGVGLPTFNWRSPADLRQTFMMNLEFLHPERQEARRLTVARARRWKPTR